MTGKVPLSASIDRVRLDSIVYHNYEKATKGHNRLATQFCYSVAIDFGNFGSKLNSCC